MNHWPFTIGTPLVTAGLLSEPQLGQILAQQREHRLPFAAVAERWFHITADRIEATWQSQPQALPRVVQDLDAFTVDTRALELIEKTPAWRYEMLPIGVEAEGTLTLAKSHRRLAAGMRHAATAIDRPINCWRVDPTQLLEWLQAYHPVPDLPLEMLDRARDAEITSPDAA